MLDEVAALVEHPTVYVGEFEAEFLAVPQECLILTMRANQKYFPLFDAAGKLLNRFLIVSNMHVQDPGNIVLGNQRVVRPRLADARFFFDTDRKQPLVITSYSIHYTKLYEGRRSASIGRVDSGSTTRLAGWARTSCRFRSRNNFV